MDLGAAKARPFSRWRVPFLPPLLGDFFMGHR